MADKIRFEVKVNNIDALLGDVDKKIFQALTIVGTKAADYAAALAPVDTGNLKNSLTSEVHEDKKQVWVGTDVEYAPSVEFGHYQEVGRYVPALGKRLVNPHVAAQPFLKPAITDNMAEYQHIIEEELKSIKI